MWFRWLPQSPPPSVLEENVFQLVDGMGFFYMVDVLPAIQLPVSQCQSNEGSNALNLNIGLASTLIVTICVQLSST